MKKLKEKLKSLITLIACGTGIAIFAYAVWFAVKHKGNGNNFLVNFMIGIMEAVFNSLKFVTEKWLEFRAPTK